MLASGICNVLGIRVRGSWHITCLHPEFATFFELGLEDHEYILASGFRDVLEDLLRGDFRLPFGIDLSLAVVDIVMNVVSESDNASMLDELHQSLHVPG